MEAEEVGNRVRRLAGDSSVSERSLSLPQDGRDCPGGGISGRVVSIKNILERAGGGWESFAVEAKGSGTDCSLCAANLWLDFDLLLVPPLASVSKKNTSLQFAGVRDCTSLPCNLAYHFNHFSFSSHLLNHLYQEIVFLKLLAVIPWLKVKRGKRTGNVLYAQSDPPESLCFGME